jgi:hypothetical protein
VLKIIAVIVALAVVVVLVLAARKPDRFRDRMVGTDFEAGLANLKTAAEHEPARSTS